MEIRTKQAVTALPCKSPKLKEYYYSIDTPTGVNSMFQRHVYQLIDDTQSLTLVHYLGDENVGVDFPHRNTKTHSHCYFCTLPSYMKSYEEKVNWVHC